MIGCTSNIVALGRLRQLGAAAGAVSAVAPRARAGAPAAAPDGAMRAGRRALDAVPGDHDAVCREPGLWSTGLARRGRVHRRRRRLGRDDGCLRRRRMPMRRDRRRSRRAGGGGGNGSDRARHHGRRGRGEGSEGGSGHGGMHRPRTCEEMKNRLRGGWEGACHTGGMPEQPHVVAVNVGRAAPLGIGDRVVRLRDRQARRHRAGGDRPARRGGRRAGRPRQPRRRLQGGLRLRPRGRRMVGGRDRPPASSRPRSARTSRWPGVDVTGARIGERWRIGSVELEVSGPRVPCSKLGARMGDPLFPRGSSPPGAPAPTSPVADAGHAAGRRRGGRGGAARPRRERRPALRDRPARPVRAWPSSSPRGPT